MVRWYNRVYFWACGNFGKLVLVDRVSGDFRREMYGLGLRNTTSAYI